MWKVVLKWIRRPLADELDHLVDGLKIPDDAKALVKAEIGKLLGV